MCECLFMVSMIVHIFPHLLALGNLSVRHKRNEYDDDDIWCSTFHAICACMCSGLPHSYNLHHPFRIVCCYFPFSPHIFTLFSFVISIADAGCLSMFEWMRSLFYIFCPGVSASAFPFASLRFVHSAPVPFLICLLCTGEQSASAGLDAIANALKNLIFEWVEWNSAHEIIYTIPGDLQRRSRLRPKAQSAHTNAVMAFTADKK